LDKTLRGDRINVKEKQKDAEELHEGTINNT